MGVLVIHPSSLGFSQLLKVTGMTVSPSFGRAVLAFKRILADKG